MRSENCPYSAYRQPLYGKTARRVTQTVGVAGLATMLVGVLLRLNRDVFPAARQPGEIALRVGVTLQLAALLCHVVQEHCANDE